MGAVLISLGGGGGVGSDELTATLGDVLKGKTVVASDTSDEIGTGTLELTGDVAVGDVLSGKTFYCTDAKTKLTGTMPNNGAVSPDALVAGSSYAIPAGYHNGGGKVTTKSLAEQTADAILDPQFLLEGYSGYDDGVLKPGTMRRVGNYPSAYLTTTDSRRVIVNDWGTNDCWVIYNSDGQYRALINVPVTGYYDGNDVISVPASRMAVAGGLTADKMPVGKSAFGIAGTLAVTSAINFSATALSDSSIRIYWTNPSQGPWEGVFIQMSTSGYPGVSGGTRVYTGRGNNGTVGGASNYVDITGLSLGTTYYFTCTSYVNNLGNGSSYNVSAKTSGMILWDGSNLQNGCTWEYNGYRFDLTMTAGTLNNKKLIFIPKKNLTEYYLNARCFNSNSSLYESYLRSDGAVAVLPKEAWTSWTAGTKYTFNCNHIYGYDTCVRFRFGIGSRNAGDTSLSGCASLVALV